MKRSSIYSSVLFLLLFNISLSGQAAETLVNNSYTYLKSNLEFLASDELEGRETTTRGEKLAALFISEELEKYGVLPFGDNGTYFQDFELMVSGFEDNSKCIFLDENSPVLSATNGGEIAFSGRALPTEIYNNIEYEIIFAGYGVKSEEDKYNSYENLNVENKVVLLLNGTPKIDGEEILSREDRRKYRRSSAKADLAKANGASGVIILPNEETIKYWEYIKNWGTSKSFKLLEEVDTTAISDNLPVVFLSESTAISLLNNEDIDYTSLINSEEPNPESFELDKKVKFEYSVIKEKRIARNIIGLIPGINNDLDNEYVTLGAHYDHEGIKNGKVYNGADDNGSGTVTILEVARKLAYAKSNERPVLVIFHTGEEKGLKGSKYLANNSKFIQDVISHINIDMVGRKSSDSIYCIGSDRLSTELGEIVKDVNNSVSNFVLDFKFDDPKDPQRLYYRSDHVHYANKGIPIVFFYDYMKKDYHKPTDTVDKINFDKVLKMTEYIFAMSLRISNLDHKLEADKLEK